MSPDQSQPAPATCPRCSAVGTGRFCTECGAPLNGAPCAFCGQPLTPGSKFCHHCGAGAGAGAGAAAAAKPAGASTATMANTLPWAVAAIAFLTLFAMLASKGFNAKRGSSVDAPMNALPNPTVDAGAPDASAAPFAATAGAAGAAGGAAGGVRAPDISNLSPTDIANRLFDRVMRLNDEGKSDSVAFFAPMAVQAYQMVEQEQGHPLDADQRFDVGRIAEVAGALPIAKAQADTILQQQPDHLLGLILAGQVAKLSGNMPALSEYRTTFARVKAHELTRKLPEYTRHKADIAAGI